jgi:thioredoxin 1
MTDHVTDNEFETKVLKSSKPVLVDFWAEWCGPCKMLGPVIDELANEIGERITILKMNVDDNPKIPSELGIRGIPALIIFKDGKQVDTKVGVLPKSSIQTWIESVI